MNKKLNEYKNDSKDDTKNEYDILNHLDAMDVEEVESALVGLEEDTILIDQNRLNRIQKAVYQKTGITEKQKPFMIRFRKPITIAACFGLLLLVFSIIGFDTVAKAFEYVFSFIPGYGIVENNDKIQYVISETGKTDEDETGILTLKNAVAETSGITVYYSVQCKDFNEKELMEKYTKEEILKMVGEGSWMDEQAVLLTETGEEVTGVSGSSAGGSSGGGLFEIDAQFFYELPSEAISPNTEYTIKYRNLEVAFTLKEYDTYQTLEEIGSTATNNDISITAVSTLKDGLLDVTLYPVNGSKFNIEASLLYPAYGRFYIGGKLHMELFTDVDSCMLPETILVTERRERNSFIFDLSNYKQTENESLQLVIPYLIVTSEEEDTVTVPIPKVNETIQTNIKVVFDDSTMIIKEITHVKEDDDYEITKDYEALKLVVEYENRKENQILEYTSVSKVDIFGRQKGSSGTAQGDGNGIIIAYYHNLEEDDLNGLFTDSIRLKFSNPQYILTDEYVLKIER